MAPLRHGQSPEEHPVQSATGVPENAADDQGQRLKRYLITMGIRTASFVLAVVTTGWVRWSFVVLAVILPYIAVVAVNAVAPRVAGRGSPVTPTGRGPRSIGQ